MITGGTGWQNIVCLLNQQGIPNPTCHIAERGRSHGRAIKHDFGLWNKVMVGRMLINGMYTGVMIQGRRKNVSYKSKVITDTPEGQWYRVEGTHEAIIDRETFQTVQRRLKLRNRTDGAGETYLLVGLVECADCSSIMSKYSKGNRLIFAMTLFLAFRYHGTILSRVMSHNPDLFLAELKG